MSALLDNPELMATIMEADPRMRAMAEQNPEIRQMLRDPAFLRQMTSAMRNPALMDEMMRNQDRALSNIESIPGGMSALSGMYQTMERSERAAEPTIPGVTDESNRLFAERIGADLDANVNAEGPNESALPNPWATPSAPARPAPSRAATAATSGVGAAAVPNSYPAIDGLPYAPQVPTPAAQVGATQAGASNNGMQGDPFLNALLAMNNTQQQQQPTAGGQQAAPNPAEVQAQRLQMLGQLLQFQQALQAAQHGQNPQQRQQQQPQVPYFNPLFVANPYSGYAPPQPMATAAVLAAAPATPPVPHEERFKDELEMMNGMGFTDKPKNIKALLAAGGNVDSAINYLLDMFPGLTYEGNMVIGGWDELNQTNYSNFYGSDYPKFFFWLDIMAELAVKAINANPNMLSGVHVNIKRFNDFDRNRVDEVQDSLLVDSGGFAATVIQTIHEEHPVNGAIYTAAVSSYYQLPFINPAAWSVPLLDRNKFGYFMQMDTMTGAGKAVGLLFEKWNIKRVAVIYKMNDPSWSIVSRDIIRTLQSQGVAILTTLDINAGSTEDGIAYLAESLAVADARYIIIMSDAVQVGDVYYKLASINASVGDQYVWLGMNLPLVDESSPAANPEYYKLSRGFISFNGFNNYNDYMTKITDAMLVTLNHITAPYDFTVDFFEAWYGNLFPAYDCIMVLAAGFNNLIKDIPNGRQLLSERKLQHLMNSSLFMNTGYRGFDGDPLLLSEVGDLQSTWNFFTLAGNETTPIPVNFASTDMNLTRFYYVDALPIMHDGTPNPPPDGSKPQTEIVFPLVSSFGVTLLALIGIGVFSSIFCFLLSIKYRHVKAMKKGSTAFNLLIAGGTLFSFIGQISYTGRCIST
ncbi:UNVERIFIED_CONTAM: hypothetical protein HDU68_002900 [Siphonaria sp. JEL0065]|nr:hypothetical protein HDU68_002900 [Siphonaria sp. JEL0065]